MKLRLPVIIALVIVASLSVAGCTVPTTSSPTPTPTPIPTSTPTPTPMPTSTPTPPVDYSSALTKSFESSNFIMERPFTKSINERGNDVYKGVGRNATDPGSKSVTLVTEVTKSQAEAKQVYDSEIRVKLDAGYTAYPESAAKWKPSGCPDCIAVWMGAYGDKLFVCEYGYDYTVNGWLVTEQSVASS